MAVLIGHASADEKGRTKNGIAGDQTRKEVCTRPWYNKPWNYILRCKDPEKAEKMAAACEYGCANDNIGYDQNQRNSLNTQAKKAGYDLSLITAACETDCSAFMTVCAQAAGINIPYNSGNAPTTSTMKSAFTKTGEFEVLTDSRYLTTDRYLKRGDIMVRSSSHTAMALQNGSAAASDIAFLPNISDTDIYTKTQFIRDIQTAIGARADGIAGPETLSKTVTVSRFTNNRHPVVRPIQRYLNTQGCNCGAADGIAGQKFDSAVKAYQTARGCIADGEITARKNTWKYLLGLK